MKKNKSCQREGGGGGGGEDYEQQQLLLEWAELVLPWLPPNDLASFSSTCKSLHHLSKSITTHRASDASRSSENHSIPFLNTVDNHPYSYFIYTPVPIMAIPSSLPLHQYWAPTNSHNGVDSSPVFDPRTLDFASLTIENENGVGCECRNCSVEIDGEFDCPCSTLRPLGLIDEEFGVMTECGANCTCGIECGNRLTQRGVAVRLKIVRDLKKGWGLHANQFIRRGEFVCEYAGELLTTEEARRRQQKYDELASHGRFSSALLVVREHLPSGKACLRMNIDATRVGNVARFINHSCDGGNLSTILVRRSGALLPHLCFFAARDIVEGEELAFSYGDVRLRQKGLPCFCASSCCFAVLPSEHT